MTETAKKDVIVFIEFVDEARIFLNKYGHVAKGKGSCFRIVTFHPLVKVYLQKRNINCIDSFKLCRSTNHQKLIEVLENFTVGIRSECSIKDSNGVQESYTENLLFHLRVQLSHILYRIEVVSEAVKKYNPKKLITIGTKTINYSPSWTIGSNERYLSQIASQVSFSKKLEHDGLIIPNNPYRIDIRKGCLELSKVFAKQLIYWAVGATFRKKGRLTVAPSISHSMGDLLSQLGKQSGPEGNIIFGVMYLDPIKALKNTFKQILGLKTDYFYIPLRPIQGIRLDRDFIQSKSKYKKKIRHITRNWQYRNVNLSEFVRHKYDTGYEPLVIDVTWKYSRAINAYLERWKPDFIIAQYARMESAVLGELASLKKIHSMIVPHGSFVGSTDPFSLKEWRENSIGMVNTAYEIIAKQTPLISNFIKENKIQRRAVATGPLIFGSRTKITEKTITLKEYYGGKKKKIILHASTPKIRSAQRLLNYETLDEYVDGIISLIETIKCFDDIHLIIRYREIDGMDCSALKELLPNEINYSIESRGNFKDYLSIADLLVSFSSTTIEEALQNNIPVMLYNKYGRYSHVIGMELNEKKFKTLEPSAVYNINREQDLYFGLKWIMSNHLNKELNDEILFEEYKYKDQDKLKVSAIIESHFRR